MGDWFVYDGEDYSTVATEDEARRLCDEALESYRDVAADQGWPEEVVRICYGRLVAVVVESERHEHLPACGDDDCDPDCVVGPFDYSVDYALRTLVAPAQS